MGAHTPASPTDSRTGSTDAARIEEIGADAYLLERMAADRGAFASDAGDVDPVEARQARANAAELRTLALRHAVHHARSAGRGALPPVVKSDDY